MKKQWLLFLFVFFSLQLSAQNNALNFDGVDDFVSIPGISCIPSGTTMTIEFWYKPGGATEHAQTLMSRGSGNDYWLIQCGGQWNNTSSIYFYLHTATKEVFASFAYDFSIINQWHHFALVFNGTAVKLYSDGKFIGQDFFNSTLDIISGPVWLGGSEASMGGFYQGAMDDLRIWNTARSTVEINTDMITEPNPLPVSLTAYYQFNQGAADGNNTGLETLLDATSNASNGSLINFALAGTVSNWVAGHNMSGTLPVSLLSFNAFKSVNSIELRWTTAQEDDLSAFDVERSVDAVNFQTIGTIKASGQSNSERSYSFRDFAIQTGTCFYRLRMKDNDGTFSFSRVVQMNYNESTNISVYPNPATERIMVSFKNRIASSEMLLLDLNGKLIRKIGLPVVNQISSISVIVADLTPGIYFIHVNGQSLKFLKQ